MEAPVALFTVATDSVANVSAETPAGIRVHVHKPNADYAVVGDLHQVIPARSSPPREGQGMQGLDPHCRMCILSVS